MTVLGMRDSGFHLKCIFRHFILGRDNEVSTWSIYLNRELMFSSQTHSVSPHGERHFLVFKVRKRQQAQIKHYLELKL